MWIHDASCIFIQWTAGLTTISIYTCLWNNKSAINKPQQRRAHINRAKLCCRYNAASIDVIASFLSFLASDSKVCIRFFRHLFRENQCRKIIELRFAHDNESDFGNCGLLMSSYLPVGRQLVSQATPFGIEGCHLRYYIEDNIAVFE